MKSEEELLEVWEDMTNGGEVPMGSTFEQGEVAMLEYVLDMHDTEE